MVSKIMYAFMNLFVYKVASEIIKTKNKLNLETPRRPVGEDQLICGVIDVLTLSYACLPA